LLKLLKRKYRGNTFWVKFFIKDSCQTKVVFLCPILELKLMGLESVDVVLVDVETKRFERWQQVILLQSFCYPESQAELTKHQCIFKGYILMKHVNRYAVKKIQIT
jgi:hypothetical protein